MIDPEENAITLLEEKISRLEKLAITPKNDDSQPLIPSLLAANNLLTAAANKGKNIQAIYSRLPELTRLQSDGVRGNPTFEFDRQLNLVLSLSNQYNDNAHLLNKVASLHASLNQGNLKCLDELRPELVGILDEYAELLRQMEASSNSESLREAWQQIVSEIVKALGATNNCISQLEDSKQTKK